MPRAQLQYYFHLYSAPLPIWSALNPCFVWEELGTPQFRSTYIGYIFKTSVFATWYLLFLFFETPQFKEFYLPFSPALDCPDPWTVTHKPLHHLDTKLASVQASLGSQRLQCHGHSTDTTLERGQVGEGPAVIRPVITGSRSGFWNRSMKGGEVTRGIFAGRQLVYLFFVNWAL